MILGTAGHIDHGKTALVRALTGVDTDRLPEEKRRGITIDLGFAPLEIDGAGTIGIVDVPGHEGFIRTMLAGASGIDLAMLVVAADEGVMPQTREHLDILSLLQIPRGVIALTKCDLVDAEWRSLVHEDVRALCAGTMLESAEIVCVSALTGENLTGLRNAIARAAGSVTRRRSDDLFRMPVDRVFTVRGTGTVVTGTIWSGSVSRDATLRIQPGARDVRVRGVQTHGKSVDRGVPGTRTALALSGCELADIERGSSIVSHREWIPTREMDVVLTLVDRNFKPTPRTRVRLHIGTSETGARLSRLRPLGSDSLSSRLILDEPIMARGRDRFVIRVPSPAMTVGGGQVIDPYPPRTRRTVSVDWSDSPKNLDERLAPMLEAAGVSGVVLSILPIRTGYERGEIEAALDRVGATRAGDRVFAAEAIRKTGEFIERFLALEMANHPLEAGVSLQTLRAAAKAPGAVIDVVLDRLAKKGRIEVEGSIVKPAGWVSRLDDRDQAVSDAILHAICTAAAEPPSISELENRFGSATAALVRRLERQGEVERVAEDRYYARKAVSGMVEALRSSLVPGRSYSPGELREVLGMSRKYLIPFLEFCDRTGVTERRDAGRVLRL